MPEEDLLQFDLLVAPQWYHIVDLVPVNTLNIYYYLIIIKKKCLLDDRHTTSRGSMSVVSNLDSETLGLYRFSMNGSLRSQKIILVPVKC